MPVAPSAGAWIEIAAAAWCQHHLQVAPSAGAWIEINSLVIISSLSPVAPSAGAWIEIGKPHSIVYIQAVAPSAGAWIEILLLIKWIGRNDESLPPRERGLKFVIFQLFCDCLCRSLRGSVD